MRATSLREGNLYTRSLLILVCYALFEMCAYAQFSSDTCPYTGKVICALPETYGRAGLVQGDGPLKPGQNNKHLGGHFESSFISSLGPLNAAVGSQLTLLPLGSPGSGLVYVYDPALKTFTASTEDLGPILTERANTTGRHKVRVGITYQRFSFGTLDGASLHSLPASFTHIMDPGSMGMSDWTCAVSCDGTINKNQSVPVPPITNCTAMPMTTTDSNTDLCGFVRDRIDTVTKIDLRLNQVTASATLGLTNRIDVSLAIPIINVGMDVVSTARIINNSNTSDHLFKMARCSPNTAPCSDAVFRNSSSASGIGDIVLRAKGVVWSGERAAVAVGADLRFPTGDELNFLGSGTFGFTPFAVFSYAARVSPHVNVGYEVNGNSVLAGTISQPTCVGNPPVCSAPSTISDGHLPNQFLYSGGADVILVRKRLAGTFDLIGQRVLNARRSTIKTQMFLGPCGPANMAPGQTGYCSPSSTSTAPDVPNQALTETKGSFNITSASLGAKVRITDKFVIFGNALIKLDDGGLRAKVVPLVGASFGF
jgi:hypothetical protein